MAAKVINPRPATGPCDICGDAQAPFGYQPPGGAWMLKPGKRPMRACRKLCCRFKANARLMAHAAPISRAVVDPVAPAAGHTPRTPRKVAGQKSLF